METAEAKALESIDRFVSFYQENALTLPCRKVELTGRKSTNPKIIRTLLGYELQIGGKRFSCPDIPTALFLKVFALIGIKEVSVPLDPTKTADMVPELEKRLNEIFQFRSQLESGNSNKAGLKIQSLLKSRIKNLGGR